MFCTIRGARTFFALSESSVDSIVMYFLPLTLTPLEMTALVSLLSLKEEEMAVISAGVSCSLSVVWHVFGRQGISTALQAHRR